MEYNFATKYIFEKTIDYEEIKLEDLYYKGIYQIDIDILVKEKIIEINDGKVILIAVNELENYGERLFETRNYSRARECFMRCDVLSHDTLKSYYYLFLDSINTECYDEALEYYLKNILEMESCHENGNYFLYLLSMVTDLSCELKDRLDSIRLEDIYIKDENIDIRILNEINNTRKMAWNHNFYQAKQNHSDVSIKYSKISIQDKIIGALLNKILKNQSQIKSNILDLVKKKDYESLIDYLSNLKLNKRISKNDECLLFLLSEMSKIKNSDYVPEPVFSNSNNLFDLIYNYDFKKALTISTEILTKRNVDLAENSLNIVLREIVSLVDSKKDLKTDENAVDKIRDEFVDSKNAENIEEEDCLSNDINVSQIESFDKTSVESANLLKDIIADLVSGDLNSATNAIKYFLARVGYDQYEFLILDLIKISLLEKDIAFTEPMLALILIYKNNYNFNMADYIKAFYHKLIDDKFDIARIYLDILSKSSILGCECILTSKMEYVLKMTEQNFINSKKEKNIN